MNNNLKIFISILVLIATVSAFTSCDKIFPIEANFCQHRDIDDNGICDNEECGEEYSDGVDVQHAHEFGLEPHFGCCTSNFGQGWPKLALSAFMRARDGAVSAVPVPSEVKFKYRGASLEVALETEYPFKNSFVYRVRSDKKTSAKLHIRIPSFAEDITVNGEIVSRKPMLTFGGFDEGETLIAISYSVTPELISRPGGMLSARRGSLIFALPVKFESKKVEYTKNGVERKFPYCDYHLKGVSDWNYGFASRLLAAAECECVSDGYPFSSANPPVKLVATLCHIDWRHEPRFDRVCAKTPYSRKALDEPASVELYPYGCAKLRVTEMPEIK